MSVRKNTPCDCDGICPYEAEYGYSCEYWCGEEDEDYPDDIQYEEMLFELECIDQENKADWDLFEEIRQLCEEES